MYGVPRIVARESCVELSCSDSSDLGFGSLAVCRAEAQPARGTKLLFFALVSGVCRPALPRAENRVMGQSICLFLRHFTTFCDMPKKYVNSVRCSC